MPNTQLPFELVEVIISELWYSEYASDVRIAFMTACPLVCNLWRDVYASITSRDIYVLTVTYLFYLSSIIRSKKSSVYRPFLSKSTRAIICHADFTQSNSDSAMFLYLVFCYISNYSGFRKCLPTRNQALSWTTVHVLGAVCPTLQNSSLSKT
ncbi:hypothetical protein DFS33DRAFT_208959 [Desarmillaria ectypa]|nr:hypothetical protein DFS33DRAFT_208959 [Desarmillaria ectypa]